MPENALHHRWLKGFYITLGREATVALEVVGELETHQPTASPSFLKSDPDR